MTNERRRERLQNWQRQAWLTEYEVCQQAINSTASVYWIIVGIFMGMNTVLLGAVAYNIYNISEPLHEHAKWVVSALGGAVIIIVTLLKFWLNRINFLIRVNHRRMQEIESQLGMLNNLTVHWIDNPAETPDEQRERVDDLRRRYGQPRRAENIVRCMFNTMIILWLFLVLSVWLPLIKAFPIAIAISIAIPISIAFLIFVYRRLVALLMFAYRSWLRRSKV